MLAMVAFESMSTRKYKPREESDLAGAAAGGVAHRTIGPVSAGIAGIAIYAAVYMVAPVSVVMPISFGAWTYLAACYAAYFGAALMPKSAKAQRPHPVRLDRTMKVAVALALIGVLARTTDRFFVRGASLSQALMERRSAIESTGSNLASVVAALLVPLCFALPLLAASSSVRGSKPNSWWIMSMALFFYPAIDALMIGSRSILLASSALAGLYLSHLGVVRWSLRSAIGALSMVAVVISTSTAVFTVRLDAMGMDALWSAQGSVYAFTIQPSEAIMESLRSSSPESWSYRMLYAVLNTSQYFLHGLLEFGHLYDSYAGDHAWGSVMFADYAKFAAWATGGEVARVSIALAQTRQGVFTSFFGPLYVDFGWLGPVAMALFGLLMRRLRDAAAGPGSLAAPLYLYLLVVVAFFPVVNMMVVGQGLFAITALGLLLALGGAAKGVGRKGR